MSYIPLSFGMSSAGNTAGTSGTVSNQIIFFGGNNITLSQSTSAGSATVSIVGGAGGAGLSAGISTGGNSLGTSGTVTNRLIFAGGNNITLSQVTGTGGNTVTIAAGAGGGGVNTLSHYQNMDMGTSVGLLINAQNLFMQRLNQGAGLFPGQMTVSTFMLNLSGTASIGASSTQTLAAHTSTFAIGIYTPVSSANSVLTLVNSASTSFGSSTTMSIFPHYYGNRWLSFGTAQWSSSPVFSAGADYVLAVFHNTSGANTFMSYLGQNYMNSNVRSGYWGVSTTTGNNTSPHGNYWNGVYSLGTSGFPTAISGAQINRANATAVFMPHIIMNNQYTY